jgi:hypothetical protein
LDSCGVVVQIVAIFWIFYNVYYCGLFVCFGMSAQSLLFGGQTQEAVNMLAVTEGCTVTDFTVKIWSTVST